MKIREVRMVIFMEAHENPHSGNEEIKKKFNYTFVGIWKEGLAKARQNGNWFHIRPDGSPVYSQRYDYADDFLNGFAGVRKGDLWSHIKTDGTLAHGQWFLWVLDFKIKPGLEEEGLLATVRNQDNGRKKGETFEIRPDGTRLHPKAPEAQ